MRAGILLALFGPAIAQAQPANCAARPVGPPLPLAVRVGIDGRPGVPAGAGGSARVDLGAAPANGTICAATTPLPNDILHGTRAPGGLLRGDGPRDVLHDKPTPRVTVQPGPQ